MLFFNERSEISSTDPPTLFSLRLLMFHQISIVVVPEPIFDHMFVAEEQTQPEKFSSATLGRRRKNHLMQLGLQLAQLLAPLLFHFGQSLNHMRIFQGLRPRDPDSEKPFCLHQTCWRHDLSTGSFCNFHYSPCVRTR